MFVQDRSLPQEQDVLVVYIEYVSATGAVPKGNATKENIQRMGFEEGQVDLKKKKKVVLNLLATSVRVNSGQPQCYY